MSRSSYLQIFRSTAITGGAAAFTLVAGMLKIKVLAVLGGPAAVGLVGLLQNIASTTAAVAGCGLASSAVRSIAAESDDLQRVSSLWRLLIWCNLGLGLLAGAALMVGREAIAGLINQPFGLTESAILGLSVAATLMFTTQTALLQGLRRIGDLASVNIAASVVGAVASVLPLYFKATHAVVWFVAIGPLASGLFAYFVLRTKKLLPGRGATRTANASELAPLFRLGMPIMAASVVTLVTQLLARSIVSNRLGIAASGDYQAVLAITTTYIGFILTAMAADYFPRLSALADKPADAAALVNQQVEMALTLAAPCVLALIAFSPQVVSALYSSEFHNAFALLRIQVLGDVLKILCWPIGYILLANGRGRLFIAAEVIWGVTYLGLIAILVDDMGLASAALAFIAAYGALLAFLLVCGRLLIGYTINLRNACLTAGLLAAGILLVASGAHPSGAIVKVAVLVCATAYALWRLDRMINIRALIRQRRKPT
jgi:O-antigen/teichoic acid export membrane protein